MDELVFYIECDNCRYINKKYFADVVVNDFISLKCERCGTLFSEDKILHSIAINRIGLSGTVKRSNSKEIRIFDL